MPNLEKRLEVLEELVDALISKVSALDDNEYLTEFDREITRIKLKLSVESQPKKGK